jgi:hypothetical protein
LDYNSLLQKTNIPPNFYCSQEYFTKAGWKEEINSDGIFVKDEEGGLMLPPLSFSGQILSGDYYAGFSNMNDGDFLDYEFIFEPLHPAMSLDRIPGGAYKTVRKNIRKFLENNYPLLIKKSGESYLNIVADWFEEKEGTDVYDTETLVKYVEEPENVLWLYSGDVLKGVIMYDVNHVCVNFRYCFTTRDWGLNEYARLTFFQYVYKNYPGKTINDGGSLDSPSIYQFKKKLNPIKINTINTLQGEYL